MDANAVRYPTSVADVAKALSQLCSKYAAQGSIPKTLHFSAMEAMTKYDMCLVMARCLRSLGEQAEIDHLVPEYEIDPTAATSRPRHCKLDLGVIKSLDVDVECERFESVSTRTTMPEKPDCTDITCSDARRFVCSRPLVVERLLERGAWPQVGRLAGTSQAGSLPFVDLHECNGH